MSETFKVSESGRLRVGDFVCMTKYPGRSLGIVVRIVSSDYQKYNSGSEHYGAHNVVVWHIKSPHPQLANQELELPEFNGDFHFWTLVQAVEQFEPVVSTPEFHVADLVTWTGSPKSLALVLAVESENILLQWISSPCNGLNSLCKIPLKVITDAGLLRAV